MFSMESEKIQTEAEIFEMILDSVGDESSVVARASSRVIPEDWHESHQEGQLAVDIVETKENIVAISTMAGAASDKIEVYVHNDLLTIRGERIFPVESGVIEEYRHNECFWGKFSRTVVLPVDVKGDLARAQYKNGILTIIVPKKRTAGSPVPIVIVDE
jgi:HSP20 family protein